MIGGEHYFRFNHPGELADRGSSSQRSSSQDNSQRSFEFAHNEFVQAQTARLAQMIVVLNLLLNLHAELKQRSKKLG